MNKHLGLLAMTAAMCGGLPQHGFDNCIEPEDISVEPKKKIIPKGCKEYFFNPNGYCNMVEDVHTVYTCVAMNRKSAYNKFKQWDKKH